MSGEKQHILAIRAGALGDLVFCFQSFEEIRRAHPGAVIALMTREPFAAFARAMPWFDHVIVDTHPGVTEIGGWAAQIAAIKQFAPDRIYDLQGKNRQNILYALLGGPFGPDWSGAAPLCKFPRYWPPEPDMHFTEFLAMQLRAAGVDAAPPANLSWLGAPVEKFSLPEEYAVIVAGCSPSALHKRWPPQDYAALTHALRSRNLACVAVGTEDDRAAVALIRDAAPVLVDLCGKTTLLELAAILRRAACVVGNDTGPTHLAAAVGTPTLALFSGKSNPIWSKPPGSHVAWLQKEMLADLRVDRVVGALDILLDHTEGAGR